MNSPTTTMKSNTPDVELEVLGRVLNVLEVHVKVIQRHWTACQTSVSARAAPPWCRCGATPVTLLPTCLVLQDAVEPQTAGNASTAIRAHGASAGADIGGILLEVAVLRFLVPTEPAQPRGELELHGEGGGGGCGVKPRAQPRTNKLKPGSPTGVPMYAQRGCSERAEKQREKKEECSKGEAQGESQLSMYP